MISAQDLFGLKDKTALVIGGGQGIGEAVCLAFAAAGANLCIVDLDQARADAVATRVRAYGVQAHGIAGDVLKRGAPQQLVDEASQRFGAPDCLINIIGISHFKAALDVTEAEWDAEFAINLKYVLVVAQAFAKALIAAGKPGTIASIASIDGMVGSPVHAAYGAAKAALIHLTKSLAIEWADHGIRVNTVAAGSILTPRRQETEESRALMYDSMIPMRRSGEPREIAGPLLFLSSQLSSYMTGQTIAADGGWSITNLFNAARSTTGMRL